MNDLFTTSSKEIHMDHFRDGDLDQEDYETRKHIWGSTVPIEFHIAKQDIASLEDPFPLYFAVSRQAYLGFYLERIENHFRPFVAGFGNSNGREHSNMMTTTTTTTETVVDDQNVEENGEKVPFSDIWLEYDEMPLKWHLPVGVLLDLLFLEYEKNQSDLHDNAVAKDGGGGGGGDAVERNLQSRRLRKRESRCLPWKITVHFSSFPSNRLVRLDDDRDIQWNCFNVLKEALFCKFGTTKPIMTLSRLNEARLWKAIQETDILEYDNIKSLLTEESGTTVKHFPIRILVNQHAKKNLPSKLIRPSREDVANGTLGSLLLEALPNLFSTTENLYHVNVVVQGIQPSLDTPLRWLLDCCTHPDQFLYICILLP